MVVRNRSRVMIASLEGGGQYVSSYLSDHTYLEFCWERESLVGGCLLTRPTLKSTTNDTDSTFLNYKRRAHELLFMHLPTPRARLLPYLAYSAKTIPTGSGIFDFQLVASGTAYTSTRIVDARHLWWWTSDLCRETLLRIRLVLGAAGLRKCGGFSAILSRIIRAVAYPHILSMILIRIIISIR